MNYNYPKTPHQHARTIVHHNRSHIVSSPLQSYSSKNLPPPNQGYNLPEIQKKYEDLMKENIWLKNQVERKKFGFGVESQPSFPAYSDRGGRISDDRMRSDVVLGEMIERNRYL
jgi:hypothetical protein